MTEAQDAFAYCTITDREIALSEPTDGQFLQIARASSAIERAGGAGPGAITAMARAGDVLLALIASSEDRYWVDEGLTNGTVGLKDLIDPIMEAIRTSGEEVAPRNGPVKRTRAASRGSR